jgi:hypothetical protein
MRLTSWCATLALGVVALVGPGGARAVDKAPPISYEVPYSLTVPKHVVVRAKINGKGPFNFILDTGAPAMFIAVPVGKKVGLKADVNKWATVDRFEIEGGVVLSKARARIETPFQLEGMNGLGLAGVEVHGLIGYNVLARYRMTIDFTRDKMTWAPLNYKPVAPAGLGGKGGGQGSIEALGGIMKMLGAFMGQRAEPIVVLRGFLGVTLADGDEHPVVKSVLPKGPAGLAGVKVGDKVTRIAGRGVYNTADVNKMVGREVRPGQMFKLTVIRGSETKELKVRLGEGL